MPSEAEEMPSQFCMKIHGAAVAFTLKKRRVIYCLHWEEPLLCSGNSTKLAKSSKMAAEFQLS